MSARTKPTYRKSEHPEGGWDFTYEGRLLRAVRRTTAEHCKAQWAVYQSKGKDNEQVFVAEGAKRDDAVFAAMDEIDLHNPVKPLLNAEHAAFWVRLHVKRFPAALAFEPVHDQHNALIGWTFWQQLEGRYEFAWVATDRRISPSTVGDRFQAAELLKTAVRATAGNVVPEIVGAGGVAVAEAAPVVEPAIVTEPAAAAVVEAVAAGEEPRVVEGTIVGHTGSAKGCRPKDMENPLVRTALRALGAELPQYHPGKLRLAEIRDAYDPQEPDTYDATEARGAFIEPDADAGGMGRVRGFWLEGGQFDRPGDPGLKVQLHILADRLTQAGFLIERVGAFAVTAWHLEVPEDYEPTDLWTVTGQQREEIVRVEARDFPTALEEARKVFGVRTLMRTIGGVGMRRLGKGELAARGLAWAPLVAPPVRTVPAVGGGSVPETALPTYTPGEFVITQDGERHQVHQTVWRDWGEGEPVEHIVTTAGCEMRAAHVQPAPARVLQAETDSLKGATVDERSYTGGAFGRLAELRPDAHADVVAASWNLEGYRTSEAEQRAAYLSEMTDRARWAAAKFYQGTGTLNVDTWLVIVRAAVELLATRHQGSRTYAFDPAPPVHSIFGKSIEPLESVSAEGHRDVLNAARFWARHINEGAADPRRWADLAVRRAAGAFAAATEVGDTEAWARGVVYLAEIHARSLTGEEAWTRAAESR